ncbi:MAG: hypothetical protein ACRD9L_02605, partial [Bryobacteraceae bacterium]
AELRGQWRDIWRRFGRNALRFSLMSPWARVRTVLAALLLASCLPVAAWMFTDGYIWQGALLASLPIVLLAPWFHNGLALFSPVTIYLLLSMALRSLVSLFGGRVLWKGRRI